MREKKGGALQKLKKRLSHSFGRLSKEQPTFFMNTFSNPLRFFYYHKSKGTCMRCQWIVVQSHGCGRKAATFSMAYCNLIFFIFLFLLLNQRYHEKTQKIQTIICSITITISIAVAMVTIKATKFHSMATTPKNIWIDLNQMEIFRRINPI